MTQGSDERDWDEVAKLLRQAYGGQPIPPLREHLSADDAAAAYAVQTRNTEFWIGQSRRVVGRKVGLTSPAVQQQLGVDQPDFGVLFDDMHLPAGAVLDWGAVIQPKAEAEIALVLAQDIDGPDVTLDDVRAATAYAVAAIEIVDSRIADWKITFADTVADNGSSAFFVLGETRRSVDEMDLASCEMTMAINGSEVSRGNGAACLGNPLNSAAWLARTLLARGDKLCEGDVVLTGALGPMASINSGDRIHARVSGFGEVDFSVGGTS